MIMLKIAGIYKSDGTIVLEKGRVLYWDELSENISPELPPSIKVELTLSFKENDLMLGIGGIVWATIDLRQAEIVQSTLLAQHIGSEIKIVPLSDHKLFMIKILNENDINDAIDFIWQSQSGLRLKPDWVYPQGEKNKSFEQWLNGQ
jgi:hypothetical protein